MDSVPISAVIIITNGKNAIEDNGLRVACNRNVINAMGRVNRELMIIQNISSRVDGGGGFLR